MLSFPINHFSFGQGLQFVSTWNTENLGGTGSATKVILLPMTAGPTVDWGDGTVNNLNTHTYVSGGVKTVKIYGAVTDFIFADGGDKLKLTNVSQIGGIGIVSSIFYGCANMNWTATDTPTIYNMGNAFRACDLFNADISNWDVSAVIGFISTFRDCDIFNQDLSAWDMSSAVSLNSMFFSALAFNQDLSAWDTSNVTAMANALRNTSFDQDISSLDISNVVDLTNFLRDSSFTQTNYDLLLPAWEAQSVQDNVTAHFGSAQYGAGAPATARADLIADHTWTITDGGPA
jgi:surface protein